MGEKRGRIHTQHNHPLEASSQPAAGLTVVLWVCLTQQAMELGVYSHTPSSHGSRAQDLGSRSPEVTCESHRGAASARVPVLTPPHSSPSLWLREDSCDPQTEERKSGVQGMDGFRDTQATSGSGPLWHPAPL